MKHALKCNAVSMVVLFMCSLSAPRCMGLLPRAEFSNHGLTHILRRAARTGRICVQNPAKRPFCVQMSEHMTVIHSAGGAELRAAVTPGTDRGWAAIVCHPWGKLGGDMNNPVVVSLRNGLAKRGLTVCRFNFRGVGGSTGGSSFTGSEERKDVQSVCRYLVGGAPIAGKPSCPPAKRIVLVGYSYGSMIVCSCIDSVPEVVAACAVSYPFDYTWALALWNASALWRPFEESNKRRLMVCGDVDGFCSVNNFERRSRAIKEQGGGGEAQVYEGVDHFWAGGAQRGAMVTRVAEWAEEAASS